MNSSLNRRAFLKVGGGAIAFTALSSNLFSENAPAPKHRFKKGFMMNAFPGGKEKMTWMEKFKLLKEAGFDGAEPPSHLDQKEILKARDETGLAMASVVCGSHTRSLSSASPAQRKSGVEGLKQGLRDAKAYGATSVLCVPGSVNENISYADAYQRTHDEIQKAVPVAEELGVKIAIENVWNNFLLTPLEAARYVDEFKSSAVGWHFDVGNIIHIGWPEQWIRILGNRIQKIHVKEFSRKKMNEEGLRKGFAIEYLEGDNNWPAVMKALDEINYKGWCIAEPAYRPNNVEPGERLKTISEKMDKIFAS
ncbi:MAG: sugar phosphate isomerase/epimerase family protein [Limisphaerales bacterium]